MTNDLKPETSLDPNDWEDFRKQSHKILDDMVDSIAGLRDRGHTWQPMDTEEAIAPFQTPLPKEGQGLEGAFKNYTDFVKPYPMGLNHPRFWGWAGGAGTPEGMIANMISAGFHSPNIIFQHASFYSELQVIDWFKEIFGFGKDAAGILVSGGSMANFVGLNVARHAKAGPGIRKKGMDGKRFTVYGSGETHYSVPKGLDVLGMGSDNFRKVPVDDQYRIKIDALKDMIAEDRKADMIPIAIVANAGTIKTGATDPIDALADVAEEEDLWLHCDGAFGAMAALSPENKHQVKGINRVHSLAFDLHKWLSQPYETGGVIINPGKWLEETYTYTASYVKKMPGGITDVPVVFSHRGVELSRGFRAFPFWFSMKAHGSDKFGEMITKNIDHAKYLEQQIIASPTLESMAPVPLCVVNFRYIGDGTLSEDKLEKLNMALLTQIQRRGIAVPSSESIHGKFSLRVCNLNHRTEKEDFDLLVKSAEEIGKELENG